MIQAVTCRYVRLDVALPGRKLHNRVERQRPNARGTIGLIQACQSSIIQTEMIVGEIEIGSELWDDVDPTPQVDIPSSVQAVSSAIGRNAEPSSGSKIKVFRYLC
jgi:hypothetical protein